MSKKKVTPPKRVPLPEEDNRQRFVRLANRRVNIALRRIFLIGNMSTRSMYQYTEADIKGIEDALTNAVESAILRFKGKKNLAESFAVSALTEIKP